MGGGGGGGFPDGQAVGKPHNVPEVLPLHTVGDPGPRAVAGGAGQLQQQANHSHNMKFLVN